MTFFRQYAEPVLRRWKVIVAVFLLAVIGTVGWTVTKGQTAWTATTALTTQSLTRAPEQDAVLALGYVDYFNQPTYQQVLRAEARMPLDVTLKAETGAASPIIYIEAKSTSQDAARSAARAAADAFRTDIHDGLATERQKTIDDLQKTIDAAVADLQKPTTTDAERNVILDQIRSLQGRIADIASDATNELKTLQTEPGLASSVPSPGLAIAGGAFGGLVLGVLVALALAVLDGRIRTACDAENAGATVLAELTEADDPAARERLVEHMINGLRARGARLPSAIAVVGVGKGDAARFAAELVAVGAPHGSRAVLVHADLRKRGQVGHGLVDVLDGTLGLEAALVTSRPGLAVLPAGNLDGRDPYRVMDAGRVAEVVAELAEGAALTVFDTAPLQTAPEAQVVCAAVDSVILVARRGITRRKQLRVAQAMLAAVDAPLAGVVIDAAPGTDDAVTSVGDTEPADTTVTADDPAPTFDAQFEEPTAALVGSPIVAVAEQRTSLDEPSQNSLDDERNRVAVVAPEPSSGPPTPADGMRNGTTEQPRPKPSPWPRQPTALTSTTSNGQHPDGE